MNSFTGADLCHCLAFRRSARYISRFYDRHLAPVNLAVSQFSLLAVVKEYPAISIADLSRVMVMERTTLLRALKPMREQGLLLSEAVGAKSTLALSLSEPGKRKLAEAEPYWLAAQQEFAVRTGCQRVVALRGEILDIVFAE